MFKTREEANRYATEWRKNNPEKVKASQKKYYDANKEKRLANTRQWEKKNLERVKAKAKKRWAENPEYSREWKKNNPEKCKAHDRKTKYGVTSEQYEKMKVEQDNRCAICKNPETVVHKRTGLVLSLSIDHDHKTGKARKLLCRRCNSGIGMFEEDINLLRTAIQYLEENQ